MKETLHFKATTSMTRETPHDFDDAHMQDFVLRFLDQNHKTRLGSGPEGASEIYNHPYWGNVEWDLVPLKKFESPLKGVLHQMAEEHERRLPRRPCARQDCGVAWQARRPVQRRGAATRRSR